MNSNYQKVKRRIFEIIQIGNRSDIPSRAFDIGIVTTIIINILVLFLETFSELNHLMPIFRTLENITLLIFLIEYILRIWTANFLFSRQSRGKAILKFLISYEGVVDLLTILPFFFLSGFVAFRMLRVVRIFNLFRINATYDSFHVITSVLMEKRNQILTSLFIIFVLTLASALCLYNAEHDAQPNVFDNAFSGIWWSISALLTVGYGDICPITVVGKICAIIISILGVGAVAIPTGIISAGFYEQYTKVQNQSNGPDFNVQHITIDIDSLWIGLSAKEIREKYNVIILLALRGRASMTPSDNYIVNLGDHLQVYRIPEHTPDA